MLWRFAIQPKSVHTAQTSPLSSCVSSSRTGQSRPALGLDVMNWMPSGGLPNTSSVDGRSLMPASAASLDWSISEKNLMPLLAMSALMRVIASAIGTALLTRTMPSSLSALAEEATDISRNISASEVQKFKMRFFMGRLLFLVLSLAHAGNSGFDHRMDSPRRWLKYRLALKSIAVRYCRLPMLGGYQTHGATVFPTGGRASCDGLAPDWRASTSIRRNTFNEKPVQNPHRGRCFRVDGDRGVLAGRN